MTARRVTARRGVDYAALAAAGGPGDWSARGLKARCAGVRVTLARRGVPEATLAAWWPGGADNPAGDGAWVRCFARYTTLAARPDAAGAGSGTAAPGDRAERDAALRAAVTAAALDRPERVVLSSGAVVHVFPKSYAAHEVLGVLDRAVARCQALGAAAAAAGIDAGGAAAPALLRSLAVRVWAWAVTHAGVGLPFDPHAPLAPAGEVGASQPDPPAWTAELATADLVALVAAFRRVNGERIQQLGEAFPGDGAPSRLGFEGFLTGYAAAKALDPLELLSGWSVARVLAVALTEAVGHDEAEQRAKAKAARDPKGRA